MNETPFCWRCKEDFPVAEEPGRWRMGQLRPMEKAPARIRKQFPPDAMGEPTYLCGNCYFDLTDDD